MYKLPHTQRKGERRNPLGLAAKGVNGKNLILSKRIFLNPIRWCLAFDEKLIQ